MTTHIVCKHTRLLSVHLGSGLAPTDGANLNHWVRCISTLPLEQRRSSDGAAGDLRSQDHGELHANVRTAVYKVTHKRKQQIT